MQANTANQRLPQLAWQRLLLTGLALFLAFATIMELRLAIRGFKPSLIDSPARWQAQRERAAALGARALILVGGSRILLDADVETLRRATGLEPVQLAVDGSSFVPVLADLAADPKVSGTVLVDFEVHVVADPPRRDAAYAYVYDYQHSRRQTLPDFTTSEAYLADVLHAHLSSYADGTRPLTALIQRILAPAPTPQYLRMLPDREVLADYDQVAMPYFYYFRVMRNLGAPIPEGISNAALDAQVKARIAALTPVDDGLFMQNLPALYGMGNNIQAHGGRVLFVVFPKSGYVKQTDDQRYPRALFWNRFATGAPGLSLHFEDVPALSSFTCPDGSHLDYRDRERFSQALAAALRLGQHDPAAVAPR